MPNYVSSYIAITGEQAVLENLVEKFKTPAGDIEFSLDKIVPMPETLNIIAGPDIDTAIAIADGDVLLEMKLFPGKHEEGAIFPHRYDFFKPYDYLWKEEETEKKIPKTRVEYHALGYFAKNNLRLHGATNWYDWRLQNWGSKWDTEATVSIGNGTVEMSFLAANSFPIIAFFALSEEFPTLSFDIAYMDEDYLSDNWALLTLEDGNGELQCQNNKTFEECMEKTWNFEEYDDWEDFQSVDADEEE